MMIIARQRTIITIKKSNDANYDYANSSAAAIVFRGCAEAMYKHDYGCDREMQVSDVGGGHDDDDNSGDVSDGEDREILVSGDHHHHHQQHIVGHWWR